MKRLSVFLICFLSLVLITNDSIAKGSSSSSSRSSSSSSRSSGGSWGGSKPSSSKPSSSSGSGIWGGSKPAASTPKPSTLPSSPPKTWGGSKPATKPVEKSSTPKTSTQIARDKQIAEQKVKYDSAKATGKAFPSKDAAIADWKTKNTGKYESKFKTEPTTKPSYIPNTYSGSNGYSAPISYNQQYGGYGYMDALGTFILWDALTDIAFQDRQIQQAGYYVGNPPNAPPVQNVVQIESQPSPVWSVFKFIFTAIAVFILGIGCVFGGYIIYGLLKGKGF